MSLAVAQNDFEGCAPPQVRQGLFVNSSHKQNVSDSAAIELSLPECLLDFRQRHECSPAAVGQAKKAKHFECSDWRLGPHPVLKNP